MSTATLGSKPSGDQALLTALLSPGLAQAQLSDYLLGPGDKISVIIFGHSDLSGVIRKSGAK